MVKRFWTKQELQLLEQLYPVTPTRNLADRLCRSERSIRKQAYSLGLRKNKEYLNSLERNRFQVGNRPHNFGIKGWQAGGNSVKTQFKAGHRPHDWMPVGSERINSNGTRQRKISDTGDVPRDWKSVHSIVWESYNGPVPAGHIVVFRNRAKGICIDNLELITRAENMRRNSIHRLPKPIADVCRIRGVLTRRINERTKQNEK